MINTLRIATNTLTDPGVMFGVGNTVLNAPSSGAVGILFNVAATVVCASLRARAELRKNKAHNQNQSSIIQTVLDSPRTSLAFSGVTQFAVAAVAVCLRSSFVGVAIPALFGSGNILNALKGDPIKKINKGPLKVLTTPELYLVTGLTLAGGSLAAGIVNGTSGLLAIPRMVMKETPRNLLLRSGSVLGLAAGSLVATAVNATTHPGASIATALYGIGYIAICAMQESGGVYEAAHSILVKNVAKPSPAP
jgi:hypothetical protein